MKHTNIRVKSLGCLLFILLSFNACKKDALVVKQARTYLEFNNQLVTDAMFGGMRLTLEPDGTASINPGGDIVFRATYNISGNKISVQVQQTNTKYKFTIISDEEISNENGVILKLAK